MNNYEYIISSFPEVALGAKDCPDFEAASSWIREQLSPRDRRLLDLFLEGYDEDALGPEFYDKALSCGSRFIREFFLYDLKLRNAKVRYLNRALGRPASEDIFRDEETDRSELAPMEEVLRRSDILERERGLDALMWNKAEALTAFSLFDLDSVLGFLSRLHIVWRWTRLDPASGREMFRRLVDEVRGTFAGVQFNDK